MERPLHPRFAAPDEGAFSETIRSLSPPFAFAAIGAPLRTQLIAGTSVSLWLAAPVRGWLFRSVRPPFFHF
jgi:hypothetical protein